MFWWRPQPEVVAPGTLIVSSRHCKTCEVSWTSTTRCWSCGEFGDPGGVPYNAQNQAEPNSIWQTYDPPQTIEEPWTIAREL